MLINNLAFQFINIMNMIDLFKQNITVLLIYLFTNSLI